MRLHPIQKPRVLCVDDDPHALRELHWLLASAFEVVCTADPREGVARLRCDDFDVVISAQHMPDMPGTELLHLARMASPHTMRLLLTGPPEFTDTLDAINASEVFRIIEKPWDTQRLLQTVAYAASVARIVPLRGLEQAADSGLSGPGEHTVMLLDPDPATEQQLRAAIGGEHPILWAQGIDEASAMLLRHGPAVLVLEPQMGTASALDLIRSAKGMQPHLVAVALSAERDAAVLGRLINDAQIHRFISKPVGRSYLRRMLLSALARHRELQAHPLRTARHAGQHLQNVDAELF